MKPFLILQLRSEAEASDSEFNLFLEKGGLQGHEVRRVSLDKESLDSGISLDDYSGVIVGGGPGCVSDPPEKKTEMEAKIEREVMSLMPDIVGKDFPFLGCCYGIGILAHYLGTKVSKDQYSEDVGPVECTLTAAGADDPILDGMPGRFTAFVGHKEAVQDLPGGCAHLVESAPCPYQMIRHGSNVYASQFHPELDGPGIKLRIEIYRNSGYFDPDEVGPLKEKAMKAKVREPERILANFVNRYRAG